ncbi:MAG: FG-GAP-like repeat-containing protein, partial [Kiritimatiellia bacterium]
MRLAASNGLPIALWALFWGAQAVSAAVVEVVQRSDPAGIVNQSTMVDTPANFTTQAAPPTSTGYRFAHWTINGVRTNDFTGRALNPACFDVYEAIDAVANYLGATNDADADGVPDWFEIHFYGDSAQTAGSDTDNDGWILAQEYQWDLHPGLSNSFLSGGVSMRNSEATLVCLGSNSSVYVERSDPEGLESRALVASNGTTIASTNLGAEKQGYAFAYWTVAGHRQADALGVSLTRFSLTITNNVVAVALYLPAGQDTTGDGIPDWWRLRHYGSLDAAADSDTDGDGLTLAEEYRCGHNPVMSNSFVSGGVSMRSGEPTLVNLAGFFDWSISGVPTGLIEAQSGVAQTGTVMATTNLGNAISGYEFGYWSLNGARQADALGVALSKISFAVTTDMAAVAHFFPAGTDADANGLPDWWEYRYFGAPGQDPDAAIPGGLTVGAAYCCGYSPVLSNSFRSGGVSMRNGELVSVNLQPYERVEHALVDGVLTRFFTAWPTNAAVSGEDFGADTVPGAGDWDGDGDFDLFVGASGGVVRVYENLGSAFTLNFSERTAAFAGLSPAWSDIPHPYPSLGDWNGDGRDDWAVGGDAGRIRIVSSPGNFSDPQSPATSYDLPVAGTTIALP